mmetsp:Transcript_123140/g.192358  ORF Transcript_123140/g.192358 Transcript_123140/m.192358 type:complete len:178 (+) Transcript_123140:2-535(+)
MVKILANGEIVPDDDPRAKQATQRSVSGQSGFGAKPASIHSNRSSTPSSSSPNSQASSGGSSSGSQDEENVLKGDLARLLGIYGRKQEVFGREIELVYLLVVGVLAFLYFSGNVSAVRMIVVGFVLYTLWKNYTRYQQAGGSGVGGFLGGGGMGGNSGEDSSGGGSSGSVINRGSGR